MPLKNRGQYDPRQIKGDLSRLMQEVASIQDLQKAGILEHGKTDRRFARLLETDHKTLNQITRLLGSLATPPLPPPPKKEEPVKKAPPPSGTGPTPSPYDPYYAFPEDEDEE